MQKTTFLATVGTFLVDAWLIRKGGKGAHVALIQSDFYDSVAEECIDNNLDEGWKQQYLGSHTDANIPPLVNDTDTDLIPTQRNARGLKEPAPTAHIQADVPTKKKCIRVYLFFV